MRRCTRSSSLRPASGLWRRHGQPVSGLRDARRHDPAGDHHGHRPRRGRLSLRQGDQEGGRQGDVQDGHQHHSELSRVPRSSRRSGSTKTSSGNISTRRPRASAASAWRRSPARRSIITIARLPAVNRVTGWLLEGGQYQWRRDGEQHLFNPETVFRLQHATQAGRYDIFKKYTQLGRRPERAALHAARPVRVSVRQELSRCRSRRSSRSSRSSGGSRPAR